MAAWLASLRKPSVTNQPPTPRELARTDWAVLVLIVFSLFLGLGIRNNAAHASKSVDLGENLPELEVPANWITGEQEDTVYFAGNPRSSSAFSAELSVSTRPGGVDANVVTVRTALGAQRSQDLLRYREVTAEPVTVRGKDNTVEGILVTYAYVADPTRDQGGNAPPVVVEAQDLIFPYGDQILVVTMAADATDWDRQSPYFAIVTDSLNMQIVEKDIMPAATGSDNAGGAESTTEGLTEGAEATEEGGK